MSVSKPSSHATRCQSVDHASKQNSVLQRDWQYQQNHKPFSRIGEAFILVSPKKMIMHTDNAEAIHQITSKREAFPKPTDAYTILSQYGENVLTTEGAVWRMHRKITSSSFNERNAALVFKESIHQTQGLINQWLGSDGLGNKTINSLEHDTMSLMLNIIGYVGFGLRLLWPGQTLPPGTDAKLIKYASLDAPEGHTMSFVDSLASTLDYLLVLLILPKWLLSKSPTSLPTMPPREQYSDSDRRHTSFPVCKEGSRVREQLP